MLAQSTELTELWKKLAASSKCAKLNKMRSWGVYLPSTSITGQWHMYLMHLFSHTTLTMQTVATLIISIGMLPCLRSMGEHFLFSSSSWSHQRTRSTPVTSWLFPMNSNLTVCNCEQKERGKALVQSHSNVALVLQVLLCAHLHTAFQTPNAELSREQLLKEC